MTDNKPNGTGEAKSQNQEEIKSYWYPDRTADINEVETGYKKWDSDKRIFFLIFVSVLFAAISLLVTIERPQLVDFFSALKEQMDNQEQFWKSVSILVAGIVMIVFSVTVYFLRRRGPIYLVDFVTFQPPDQYKIPHPEFMEKTKAAGFFDEDSVQFQEKLLYRTGLGNETYFPSGVTVQPPELNMKRAREEANLVMSGCLDELFQKTGLKPRDIDIFVVNCSLFNPTPSLAEMMINKYKMKPTIRFYNLSGMGCSAGVLAIDLARDLLQVHKNSNAVVISTENITQNWYTGNEKAMLISNTLFRMGGAAMLLSNKWGSSWTAKYKLHSLVRVHKGANDKSYYAVYQDEDQKGKKGVALSKDLLSVAGDALKSNLTILGPMVLPWSEQIKFFLNLLLRKYEGLVGKEKKTPSYVPDFKKAFEHFCIHAGGRAIIDGLEENLKLEAHHIEPSRATLYRYGNTSSSSIWYELSFIERSGRMKKGDRVFQIALGSGFQCNSAVWKRIN